MSFDIFVQAFENGDAGTANARAIRTVLAPHVADTGPEGYARLITDDGDADLYGYDDLATGFMVNHLVGEVVWDLVVQAAKSSTLTIMPVGCPVCVTDEAAIAHLPGELDGDVMVVTCGRELLDIVRSS